MVVCVRSPAREERKRPVRRSTTPVRIPHKHGVKRSRFTAGRPTSCGWPTSPSNRNREGTARPLRDQGRSPNRSWATQSTPDESQSRRHGASTTRARRSAVAVRATYRSWIPISKPEIRSRPGRYVMVGSWARRCGRDNAAMDRSSPSPEELPTAGPDHREELRIACRWIERITTDVVAKPVSGD